MQETRPRDLTPEELAMTGYHSTAGPQSKPFLVPSGSGVSIDPSTVVTQSSPTIPTELPPEAK